MLLWLRETEGPHHGVSHSPILANNFCLGSGKVICPPADYNLGLYHHNISQEAPILQTGRLTFAKGSE